MATLAPRVPASGHRPPGRAAAAVPLANAAAGLCQQHERPVPRPRPGPLHPTGAPGHAGHPQHTCQVLAKRSRRLLRLDLEWPSNLWMGASVENARVLGRVDDLRQVPAAVRSLLCEPLLRPLEGINLDGIHWLIAGGESGPRARPMDPQWVADLRDVCQEAEVPFFFKQWGGRTPRLAAGCSTGRPTTGCPSASRSRPEAGRR
jgi:Protein of unknown function (DUF5131)